MGNCLRVSGDAAAAQRNREIEAVLRKERIDNDNRFSYLLIGSPSSGKSTIVKQLKIMYHGFSTQDRTDYKTTVLNHTIDSVHTLYNLLSNKHSVKDELIAFMQPTNKTFTLEEAIQIQKLSEDKLVKKVIESGAFKEHKYFISNCCRIFDSSFTATDIDILHCYTKTTGVSEFNFVKSDQAIRVIDVGGQRNERRKWIHFLESVNTVAFCVSMSDYDTISEDKATNQMHEALNLFASFANNHLDGIDIVLTFTKVDLFEEKIKTVDLSYCFPLYNGGSDFKTASSYVANTFLEKINYVHRTGRIYVHFVNCLDMRNVLNMMNCLTSATLDLRPETFSFADSGATCLC